MLGGVIRSVIKESLDNSTLSEAFVVELHDSSKPYPMLGGIAGTRVVQDTALDEYGLLSSKDWEYENICDVDLTTKTFGTKSNSILTLDQLNKLLIAKYEVEGQGDLFKELQHYFRTKDAPFQNDLVRFSLENEDDILIFRQMLGRKFGFEMHMTIENRLFEVMAENEMRPIFSGQVTKVEPASKPADPSYNSWGSW